MSKGRCSWRRRHPIAAAAYPTSPCRASTPRTSSTTAARQSAISAQGYLGGRGAMIIAACLLQPHLVVSLHYLKTSSPHVLARSAVHEVLSSVKSVVPPATTSKAQPASANRWGGFFHFPASSISDSRARRFAPPCFVAGVLNEQIATGVELRLRMPFGIASAMKSPVQFSVIRLHRMYCLRVLP